MAAIAFGGSPLAVKLTCVAMQRWQPARCCGSTALCHVARRAFILCPIRAHCLPRKLVRHPVGLSTVLMLIVLLGIVYSALPCTTGGDKYQLDFPSGVCMWV